jgi:hypothetical protein
MAYDRAIRRPAMRGLRGDPYEALKGERLSWSGCRRSSAPSGKGGVRDNSDKTPHLNPLPFGERKPESVGAPKEPHPFEGRDGSRLGPLRQQPGPQRPLPRLLTDEVSQVDLSFWSRQSALVSHIWPQNAMSPFPALASAQTQMPAWGCF